MSVSTFHSDGTPFNLVFGMMYCFRQCYFSNRKVNDFIKCLYICVMDRIETNLYTKFKYFSLREARISVRRLITGTEWKGATY